MCGNQCGRNPDDCRDEKVATITIKTVIKKSYCSIIKDCPIVNLLNIDCASSSLFFLMKLECMLYM